MRLTVLSVAYPLAAVTPETAGGSEQVLLALDSALLSAGHRSLVIAPEGSRLEGRLLPIAPVPDRIDEEVKRIGEAHIRRRIARALATEPVDLVHLHGFDFGACLPKSGPPVLVTLHMPPDWYDDGALFPTRPDVWFNPVSRTQAATCPPGMNLLRPIENGVDVESFAAARHARRGYALFLGRICPEKGIDLAIAAARRAGVPLLIAGEVFGYDDHLQYFETEVRPHLGPDVRFLGPIGPVRKRRLLAAARCLLVPSHAAETSSLVAREALAAGTPVIALPNGALPDVVEDGRTGFLVEGVDDMASAILRSGEIDGAVCRAVARERFSLETMTRAYLDLYQRLASHGRLTASRVS